jgi:hypothetical protein
MFIFDSLDGSPIAGTSDDKPQPDCASPLAQLFGIAADLNSSQNTY